MKYILSLLFVAMLTTVFACQQKKTTGQGPQLPNDTTAISPNTMAPGMKEKPGDKTVRIDTSRVPLAVTKADAQVLDAGTQIGKPGDLLLTFTGSGFIFTNSNPALIAGGIRFDNSFANEANTELYVVIPAESKARLSTAVARGGLQLSNPGNQVIGIKELSADQLKRADEDKKVKLMYAKFGVERRER
ncbi:MAG: hypothetical protein HOP10_13550 [Chitinophagaceae bacterium]|nr:hypothetical protein [Chitinophagaceae bacterium]